MSKEKIKARIETLYGEVFNKGKANLLPGLVAGPYIQHNPLFPDETAPLVEYLNKRAASPVRSSAWQLTATWLLSMYAI